jgi:hypothetical protein
MITAQYGLHCVSTGDMDRPAAVKMLKVYLVLMDGIDGRSKFPIEATVKSKRELLWRLLIF